MAKENEKYLPTIGLEIHAELRTATKMFCNSKNDPDEKTPNVNICPICTAQPGTLPTINKEAVKHVLKLGLALDSSGKNLSDYSEFDRKNYFYPDIPKGYQISQYKYPLVSGGSLQGIQITRVHLEEDTARSQHSGDFSLIDFNRAGVPLMELVTEPVMHDAKTAGNFARELRLLLRYLGASEADMEKGQMRVEANVSVAKIPEGEASGKSGGLAFGTKVEVKNINSFRAVEKAIDYEIKRQIEELEGGGVIVQETRGWDDVKQKTFSQRKKESSHDYRYFPEPDLPKLKLSEVPEFSHENLKRELPELPWVKRERYAREFGIKGEDIESYVADLNLANFFESVVEKLGGDKDKVKLASNYITSDLAGHLGNLEVSPPSGGSTSGKREIKFPSHEHFAKLINMISAGELSSRGGKDVLLIMHKSGGDPEVIAKENSLIQKHNESELIKIVEQVINDNDKVVADYKSGKQASLQYLVGQSMKLSKGSANPNILQKILLDKLK